MGKKLSYDEIRNKVRDFYLNSDIGLEDIVQVIVNDMLAYTYYDDDEENNVPDENKRMYDFWEKINDLLYKWSKKNKNKTLKIYCPVWKKGKPITNYKALVVEFLFS